MGIVFGAVFVGPGLEKGDDFRSVFDHRALVFLKLLGIDGGLSFLLAELAQGCEEVCPMFLGDGFNFVD